jgi:hypothetical protein
MATGRTGRRSPQFTFTLRLEHWPAWAPSVAWLRIFDLSYCSHILAASSHIGFTAGYGDCPANAALDEAAKHKLGGKVASSENVS